MCVASVGRYLSRRWLDRSKKNQVTWSLEHCGCFRSLEPAMLSCLVGVEWDRIGKALCGRKKNLPSEQTNPTAMHYDLTTPYCSRLKETVPLFGGLNTFGVVQDKSPSLLSQMWVNYTDIILNPPSILLHSDFIAHCELLTLCIRSCSRSDRAPPHFLPEGRTALFNHFLPRCPWPHPFSHCWGQAKGIRAPDPVPQTDSLAPPLFIHWISAQSWRLSITCGRYLGKCSLRRTSHSSRLIPAH